MRRFFSRRLRLLPPPEAAGKMPGKIKLPTIFSRHSEKIWRFQNSKKGEEARKCRMATLRAMQVNN